jgi:Family of unknown function (DUF7019)
MTGDLGLCLTGLRTEAYRRARGGLKGSTCPMRSYIYYSPEKIEDLAQELPQASWWRRALGRIRALGGSGPGGIGANIAIGAPEPQPILRTMQRVWQQLEQEQQVGTFDAPKRFFYGRLQFYYGAFGNIDPPVFFLVGATDQTIVALGGSLKNVQGHRGQEIRAAENANKVTLEPDVATVVHTAFMTESADTSGESPATALIEGWDVHVVGMYQNWRGMSGSKMEFEVLARQDGRSSVSAPYLESPKEVLIGSPIFVAQT